MRITIPTELSDITLEQVQKVLILDDNPDLEDFPRKVHSLAIMTNRTAQEISTIPITDIDKIYSKVFAMINGMGGAPLQRRIKYQGREFGFIEDVRDMETGAFVDIDQMSKPENYAENLHKIMAVLYRPIDAQIGSSYRLKSYVKEDSAEREQRQALFLKYMTLDIVRGATGFFLLVTQRSLNISGNSFPIQGARKIVRQMAGDGITLSTR